MEFTSLAALLRTWAAGRPGHVALRCGPDSVTYGDLDRRSNRLGHALRAQGVAEGTRIAYLGRTSITFFETLFGGAKAGAVLVPVNWRLAAPEVGSVLADATAEVLVVDPEFTAMVEEIEDSLPALRRVVCTGEHPRFAKYADWRDGHADTDPGGNPGPGDIALQIYTSGTTGRPKGVMSRNGALLPYLTALGAVARLDAASVSLCTLPQFHIGGIGWVLAGLNLGCTTVMLRDVGGDGVITSAEAEKVTTMIAVPAVIRMVLDSALLPDADLTPLETLYYGGGPITQQVLDEALAALKCDFVQGFGLTECPLVTALPPEEHSAGLLQSCGRPIPGTEVRLVDPVTGTEAAPGAVGELWVRSPLTMAGYWGQPDATAAALADGAWLRTGDAARMDADGHVFMADRLKDMIVTGGENVYPAEVENVLARHPAVAACAVIGVPSRKWTEAVVAVVVRREGRAVTAGELIDFCRAHLAGYKRPKTVVFVGELPRTPSGKVTKYVLKERFAGVGD
jgi:long-chain acyl-CoA synthetase